MNNRTKNSSSSPSPTLVYADTDPHRLASRFVNREFRDAHGHFALRYWRNEFWRFHEGRYRKVSDAELRAQITAFVRADLDERKTVNKDGLRVQVTTGLVGNVLQALTGRVLVEGHIDQPVWLGNGEAGPYFAFSNGLVSVDGVVSQTHPDLKPHCANWFSQTAFPYAYDPAATCPQWLAFLDDVLEGDPERIALLQQWFGYCLTPDTSQQQFVVAVGEGQNGKSVVLDLLTAMLGPENVSHVRAELFAQRFQLTMTLGKLANISYDTGEIDESAEATIKEFTGGDRMYFDRKGVPGVTAYPSARLILATNRDPRFADRSKGIWRRMIVIPFRVNVEKARQDPHLAKKLKAELPGIFNWAAEGLRTLRRQGHFVVPSVCQEAWETFRTESNPARQFLTESYAPASDGHCLSCSSVYGAYVQWSNERGLKPLDATTLGKELKKAFPEATRKRTTTGPRPWCYHGLRPTADSEGRTVTASPTLDDRHAGQPGTEPPAA